ncbi:Cys-Gln thioester bond-forming surface protein [Tautonia marina]|uniref:Cys-Gln thioester bond-forming surface protein n=1 Tax=Tautonia marina TaxID=2653855 RepID=UPI00126068A0|nr:Cys-Gln thioester bond-forming surface protein [Tautonia marina]
MSRMFLRGAAALTFLFLGSSFASAFPVVNQVRTTATLSGALTGTVQYRLTDGGSLTTRNNTYALALSTRTTSGGTNQDGSISYGQITPSTIYRTYCMEITENLNQNAITTVIDRIPPGTADPRQSPLSVKTPSVAAMERAAWLVRYGEQLVGGTTHEKQAAVQLAIWEIVYDAGATAEGNINTINGTNAGFRVDSGFTATTLSNVETLLKLSWNEGTVRRHDGLGFYQNVTLNSSGTETVRLANGQNVLAAVPEPSTFAIAGLSGLAMLGLGLRRRKMARA